MTQSLQPIIALLGLGIISILLLPKIGISPIVGFILSGFILGKDGLNLIPDNHIIDLLAELGVVFLLFDIGLHFSLKRIWEERKAILIIGPLQMLLTASCFYLLSSFLHLQPEIRLLLSLGLALSSTAVVAQVIKGQGIEGLPNSDTAIGILIFQDICAIFLLILAHTLASDGAVSLGYEMGSALVKSIFCFISAILLGKYLLCPLFDKLIKHKESEVFTMIGLFLILVTGVTTNAMGLSLTLGAFLVGMIIGETPFKHILQIEIRPFRFLLLSFFFVTIGTELHLKSLEYHWPTFLILTGGFIIIKIFSVFFLFLMMRNRMESSLQQAILLSQGSEFLFVILGTDIMIEHLPARIITLFISAVATSMSLTPFLYDLIIKRLCPLLLKDQELSSTDNSDKNQASTPKVIVLGMNEVGYTVSRALSDLEIDYICVEGDYDSYLKARLGGFPVLFGQRDTITFWENLGIEKFQYVAIACPSLELAQRYQPIFKNRYPNLIRYASIKTQEEYHSYQKLGMIPILSLGVPHGLELAEKLLSDLRIEKEKIATWLKEEQDSFIDKSHQRHQV